MDDRVKSLKERFLSLIEGQLAGDLSQVNAQELGEVADMAKDMAEITKLCNEAEYFKKITEAMEKNSDESNKAYMDKYLGEEKFYTPIRMRYPDNMRDSDPMRRDSREGRSGISRRTYMEMSEMGDENGKNKELEHYMQDLSADLSEMISEMSSSGRAMVKQKLTQLAAKIS